MREERFRNKARIVYEFETFHMADVFQKVIKGSKKRHFPAQDLQEIDIDLTPYAGKEIVIDLYNRPAPGGNPLTALAYWDKIAIVSQ
jgi:hypothetical protein